RRRSLEGRRMSQPIYEIPVTNGPLPPPPSPTLPGSPAPGGAPGATLPPPSGPAAYAPPPPPSHAAADPALLSALQEVVLSGGSDLHISANAAPMIRVDGRLNPVGMPWERHAVTSALYSIMT